MPDFEPIDDDFDFDKFVSGPPRANIYKFYCPSCTQKLEFHLYDKTEDETYPCPMCNGIMLLEELSNDDKRGSK